MLLTKYGTFNRKFTKISQKTVHLIEFLSKYSTFNKFFAKYLETARLIERTF